ncbi:MAG: PIN domain-containing protein [Candidatus Woesearchaeota archaeon]|nr:PIN domain-containing protein [Candidatus Woesearchaeota archaeon]
MIIDTSFIIDLMRGNLPAKTKLVLLESLSTPLIIPTPTIFELCAGAEQSSDPSKELIKINSVLAGQTICVLDLESAQLGGKIHGLLKRKGQSIDLGDSLIAGIALTHHEPVLTRNVKDFSRVPGLRVETY